MLFYSLFSDINSFNLLISYPHEVYSRTHLYFSSNFSCLVNKRFICRLYSIISGESHSLGSHINSYEFFNQYSPPIKLSFYSSYHTFLDAYHNNIIQHFPMYFPITYTYNIIIFVYISQAESIQPDQFTQVNIHVGCYPYFYIIPDFRPKKSHSVSISTT